MSQKYDSQSDRTQIYSRIFIIELPSRGSIDLIQKMIYDSNLAVYLYIYLPIYLTD